ncbi:MAG: carbon-nitrogen hydrolase family protein [Proteobacteria bacterium]|nr:carbon-nitrogen hydrolase family protein [Pseudomonadota bacterium]
MPRVAVVQAGSVLYDTGATLAKLERLARDAASQGAELVLFPEAFVGGYPKGLDFGARMGSRSDGGRDQFRRYYDSAIALDGPEVERIAALAAKHKIHLVTGAIERDGGTLYCAALHFDPNGELIGRRRKLMPTAMERLVWGMGDGSTLSVTETPLGRVGAVICWENYMPMLRMTMYAQGVQIYCAPTVDDRDGWQATMRHIALEGRCYVLSAVQYFTRAGAPADYTPIQGNTPDRVLIRGGSAIYGPLGEEITAPVYGREAILTADIDLGILARAKYDLDVVGHYARPDIFTLNVDRRPKLAANMIWDDPASE